MLLSNLLLLFLLPPDVVVFLFGLVERRHITVKDSEKLVALSCRGVLTKQTTNAIELKQVKCVLLTTGLRIYRQTRHG